MPSHINGVWRLRAYNHKVDPPRLSFLRFFRAKFEAERFEKAFIKKDWPFEPEWCDIDRVVFADTQAVVDFLNAEFGTTPPRRTQY